MTERLLPLLKLVSPVRPALQPKIAGRGRCQKDNTLPLLAFSDKELEGDCLAVLDVQDCLVRLLFWNSLDDSVDHRRDAGHCQPPREYPLSSASS